MDNSKMFSVTVGDGDFPTALKQHLERYSGHEVVALGITPPKNGSPGMLIGVTRPSPEALQTESEQH